MINEQDCINNWPGIWVPTRFLDDDACDFSRLQIAYCKAGNHDLILGMPKFRSHFRTSRQESSHIAEAFFVLLLINMLQTVTWFLRMQRFGSHIFVDFARRLFRSQILFVLILIAKQETLTWFLGMQRFRWHFFDYLPGIFSDLPKRGFAQTKRLKRRLCDLLSFSQNFGPPKS